MADEADFAAKATDEWLQQALRATRSAAPGLKAKGQCHFCERKFNQEEDGPLFEKILFCDKSCGDDYQRFFAR